jgi:hypothetical protein
MSVQSFDFDRYRLQSGGIGAIAHLYTSPLLIDVRQNLQLLLTWLASSPWNPTLWIQGLRKAKKDALLVNS